MSKTNCNIVRDVLPLYLDGWAPKRGASPISSV